MVDLNGSPAGSQHRGTMAIPKWFVYLVGIVVILGFGTYLYKEVVKPAGETANQAIEAGANKAAEAKKSLDRQALLREAEPFARQKIHEFTTAEIVEFRPATDTDIQDFFYTGGFAEQVADDMVRCITVTVDNEPTAVYKWSGADGTHGISALVKRDGKWVEILE